ncbi:MAG TPA: hypothetical protein PK079_26370 [Leptospiraceae bacterium]|nr:hypothetical protein [Leptospiraceae bacterium]HMX35542.1 hypothetical protein [Leptospiraceae bacterium]HMY34451.1 hypothetical protein [Leptospiraceae bacterium]HMZ67557.1 hypothetical protein [Leptospiraceae bacterium]HNA10455.1 hypothetical protein [Leptospiraceae bacterium]
MKKRLKLLKYRRKPKKNASNAVKEAWLSHKHDVDKENAKRKSDYEKAKRKQAELDKKLYRG